MPHPYSASTSLQPLQHWNQYRSSPLFSTSIVLLIQFSIKDSSTNSTTSNSLFLPFNFFTNTSKTGPVHVRVYFFLSSSFLISSRNLPFLFSPYYILFFWAAAYHAILANSRLQNYFVSLEKWIRNWHIQFNPNKTQTQGFAKSQIY